MTAAVLHATAQPADAGSIYIGNDIIYGHQTYASSIFSPQTPQSNAVNGSTDDVFATDPSQFGGWWEVDLGTTAELNMKVDVLFRQDGRDVPSERRNLQIWVSNNQDMASGHTVACNLGPQSISYGWAYSDVPNYTGSAWYRYYGGGGAWQCAVPAGKWRYLAIVKTDGAELVFSEVVVN